MSRLWEEERVSKKETRDPVSMIWANKRAHKKEKIAIILGR